MRFQLEKYSLVDKLLGLIESRKPSDKLILRLLFFVSIFSGIFFLYSINSNYSSVVPTRGGVLSEGIVGIPRFVNPALAITRADQDTVALLYSGLLKIDESGNLIPELAESITVSEDGKVYQVELRQDKKFQDGVPITAKDAIFTINLVQDSNLKSPYRGNWSDVTIEEVSDFEFNVILNEAYSPFIENFTLGIMPKHIWGSLPIEQLPFSQYNTEPVSSGPFSIKNISRDASGLISSYSLTPSSNNDQKPNLSGIELRFFQNETLLENAFLENKITSTIYLPVKTISELDNDDINIITEPLPRIFGLFLNQNRSPALRDKSVRQALNIAVNRERLVNEVLGGYGVPTDKPILEDTDELEFISSTTENIPLSFSIDEAREILTKGNWEQNEAGFWEKEIAKEVVTLSLTIKTSNTDLFEKTVSIIAEDWRKLGVDVQVEQYDQTGLVQSVIRTRDFEVLFFGLDMNRTQDLYPFWHSSQKDDPGLNISQYTNITVDRLLDKTKNSQDKSERKNLLSEISNSISEETPAIFLFAPSIAYVVDKDIVLPPIKLLGKPSDRFMNISDWYAKSEVVWPFFQKEDSVKDIN